MSCRGCPDIAERSRTLLLDIEDVDRLGPQGVDVGRPDGETEGGQAAADLRHQTAVVGGPDLEHGRLVGGVGTQDHDRGLLPAIGAQPGGRVEFP